MSYFDANFDEKSFKKELNRVVKLHLKKAAAYKLGEPLAIIEAKCAIALSETEEFHKALIDSLTEKEKVMSISTALIISIPWKTAWVKKL